MDKADYEKFLKANDAIRINDYLIYAYKSTIDYSCYGAFNVVEMDGEYYINEKPSFADRGEKAKNRCIDFAMIIND